MRIDCTPTPQKNGRPYPDDIDRLTNAVTSAFMVEELYLFGSAATGTLKETSDIDLAIALKAPEREKMAATPTTDWREHAKRGLAADRRRETAIEKTFRKTVGWRRAIDIVFLEPGEANEETTTDDVVHAIQNEGVVGNGNRTDCPTEELQVRKHGHFRRRPRRHRRPPAVRSASTDRQSELLSLFRQAVWAISTLSRHYFCTGPAEHREPVLERPDQLPDRRPAA